MIKYLLALILLVGCANSVDNMTRRDVLEDYCSTREGVWSFTDNDTTHWWGTCGNGDYYIYNNGKVTKFNLNLDAQGF